MWKDKKLGEIVNFKGGGTPSKQNTSFWNGNIPWASVKDIKGDYLETTESKITKNGVKNSSTKVCSAGDLILITRISPGKSIISKIDCAINQDLKIVDVHGDIDKMFLHYFFKSQIKEIEKKASGTTVLGISLNELKQFAIPLPPLPTQHRIVEKIEELFSELDNGVENLKKAQKQLKTYRQAVLKYAFEGKLTQEWREQQDDLPTPHDLLQQIKTERKAHRQREIAEWEKEVEQWEKDGNPGRKPRKPRKSKLFKVDENNFSGESKLNITLSYISGITAGHAFKKGEYSDEGVRLFKIANVGFGKAEWESIDKLPSKYIQEWEHLSLKFGDLLIAMNRPILNDQLKVCRLKQSDIPAILYQRVGRFDLFNKDYSKYVFYYLRSPIFLNYLKEELQGIDIPFVNNGKLLSAPFSFCSLEEQKEIVNKIESRLSVVEQLEQTIKENLQKAEALRQSILKKAFGGDLID